MANQVSEERRTSRAVAATSERSACSWAELDGDELRKERSRKNPKRARKSDVFHQSQAEQTEALLRSNSRGSVTSDKVGEERNA